MYSSVTTEIALYTLKQLYFILSASRKNSNIIITNSYITLIFLYMGNILKL